ATSFRHSPLRSLRPKYCQTLTGDYTDSVTPTDVLSDPTPHRGDLYDGKVTSERGNLQVTFPRTRPPEVVPRQPVGIEYAWDADKLVRQSDVFDAH
ncbi:hypothetical protein KI387_009332, partial [Taxus chinensis]